MAIGAVASAASLTGVAVLTTFTTLISIPFGDAAVATILASIIAGAVGYATNRNSTKATAASSKLAADADITTAATISRTDMEKEAFNRAAAFYTDTIDRQDRMIATRDARILALEAKETARELENDALEAEVDELKHARAIDQAEITRLRDDLVVATRLLGEKYPDEP